jgi:hypothetical protein
VEDGILSSKYLELIHGSTPLISWQCEPPWV